MRKICLHVVITAWALKAQREQVDYYVAMGMGAYFFAILVCCGWSCQSTEEIGSVFAATAASWNVAN